MDVCSCPFHQGIPNLWTTMVQAPPADVRCPMCDRPFCSRCFVSCGHKCDWGGGVGAVERAEREPVAV